MNFRIITKNHTADSKIRFPRKIDFRADGTHESHPTAWELSTWRTLIIGNFSGCLITSGWLDKYTTLIHQIFE